MLIFVLIAVDARGLPPFAREAVRIPMEYRGLAVGSHGNGWKNPRYAARHRGIYPCDAPRVPVERPTGPYGKPESKPDGIPRFPMEDVHNNAADWCHRHVSFTKKT